MGPRHRPLLTAPLVALLSISLLAALPLEGSQEAAAPGASPPPPTIEGVRGQISVFGGAMTAGADGLESGTLFGGSGAFFFLKRLGLEVGVHRRSVDAVATSSNALSGGSLDSTIVTGGFILRFPLSARVAPYVVGGVAYFSNTFAIDPAVSSGLEDLNFRVTETVESAVGFQVGAGVDFLLARRFAVFGEARYLGGSTDTRAELTDTISGTTAEAGGSQDLNGLEIRVGIRFVFPRGRGKVATP